MARVQLASPNQREALVLVGVAVSAGWSVSEAYVTRVGLIGMLTISGLSGPGLGATLFTLPSWCRPPSGLASRRFVMQSGREIVITSTGVYVPSGVALSGEEIDVTFPVN